MHFLPNRDLPSWADDMVRVTRAEDGNIEDISSVGHRGEYWSISRENPTTWKVSIQREHGLIARLFSWHLDRIVFRLTLKNGEVRAQLEEIRTERH